MRIHPSACCFPCSCFSCQRRLKRTRDLRCAVMTAAVLPFVSILCWASAQGGPAFIGCSVVHPGDKETDVSVAPSISSHAVALKQDVFMSLIVKAGGFGCAVSSGFKRSSSMSSQDSRDSTKRFKINYNGKGFGQQAHSNPAAPKEDTSQGSFWKRR